MKKGPIHLPALSARMGDWRYYTTVMRLADAKVWIEFADEVAEIRPGRQLSDLIQRALTKGRAAEIAKYLVGETDHFFNALVVAVYGGEPEWMEFNVSPTAGTRSKDGGDPVPAWARSAFGYLHLTGTETLFALDGQHRLAGIKLAVADKPELADELVSVIVVSHKKTDAGRRRTRKLFTTLNKTAVAVNKSEIIALDESDTGAIITRRLVEEHPYFSRGQVLTKYGTTNLSATDAEHFMTIIKLYDVVTYLLGYVVNSLTREARIELRYVRPKDDELEKHYIRVVDFLEKLIAAIPELKSYFSKTGDAAKAVVKGERFTNRNVLFRAVGLDIFLRLTPKLVEEKGSIKAAIAVLSKIPRAFTNKPYRDVLYSVAEEKILPGRVTLTIRLLKHMLGFTDRDKVQLIKAYAEAIGEDPDDVKLPARIAGIG
ncbi:MAG: DGQHR domain-containing protein [Sphingomonas sp.]|uniref:DGQHR domain-containing protein n=1 Tax=Sphingomonas sp. TaxID=28214 RepID=UPI00121E2627|nr:DNA sulfur modification protein DndB [Sphingomonas sp.]THD34463.1 MAG: DGQHR domain-containing protein [Sphingomonas sp.]